MDGRSVGVEDGGPVGCVDVMSGSGVDDSAGSSHSTVTVGSLSVVEPYLITTSLLFSMRFLMCSAGGTSHSGETHLASESGYCLNSKVRSSCVL